jgi:hypothetical protein
VHGTALAGVDPGGPGEDLGDQGSEGNTFRHLVVQAAVVGHQLVVRPQHGTQRGGDGLLPGGRPVGEGELATAQPPA